jgi:cytochrome P450
VAQPLVNGKRVASLFMTTDEDHHKTAKRPIAHAYAMTSLLDYEPFVDSTSRTLVEQLTRQYANTGRVCDFGEWLQWYAFDVIGEMTFSNRFGFLEQAKDVGNIIQTLNKSGTYTAIVGQMPWLDLCLGKNRLWGEALSKDKWGVSRFVLQFLKPRIEEADRVRLQGTEKAPLDFKDRTDFTAKFISAFDKYHGSIPQSQLLGWSLSNINAGSDTTAITLRAIFRGCFSNQTIQIYTSSLTFCA